MQFQMIRAVAMAHAQTKASVSKISSMADLAAIVRPTELGNFVNSVSP